MVRFQTCRNLRKHFSTRPAMRWCEKARSVARCGKPRGTHDSITENGENAHRELVQPRDYHQLSNGLLKFSLTPHFSAVIRSERRESNRFNGWMRPTRSRI